MEQPDGALRAERVDKEQEEQQGLVVEEKDGGRVEGGGPSELAAPAAAGDEGEEAVGAAAGDCGEGEGHVAEVFMEDDSPKEGGACGSAREIEELIFDAMEDAEGPDPEPHQLPGLCHEFSRLQVREPGHSFHCTHCQSALARKTLEEWVGETEARLRAWFRHRLAKSRKHHKK